MSVADEAVTALRQELNLKEREVADLTKALESLRAEARAIWKKVAENNDAAVKWRHLYMALSEIYLKEHEDEE